MGKSDITFNDEMKFADRSKVLRFGLPSNELPMVQNKQLMTSENIICNYSTFLKLFQLYTSLVSITVIYI